MGAQAVSGGKIHCSTGAGTFNQSLDYTALGATMLPTWHTYVRASVTVSGSSFGIGGGIRSCNINSNYDAVARVQMTATGQGILNLDPAIHRSEQQEHLHCKYE